MSAVRGRTHFFSEIRPKV